MNLLSRYVHIKEDVKLSFTDLFNLVYLYQEIEEQSYINPQSERLLFNAKYIEFFIVSLLVELGSKYKITDYIHHGFESDNYGIFVLKLFMIRNNKMLFSYGEKSEDLGNGNYIHNNVTPALTQKIEEIFVSSEDNIQQFKKDIYFIDQVIVDCIGENYNRTITLGDFYNKYGSILDINKFKSMNI